MYYSEFDFVIGLLFIVYKVLMFLGIFLLRIELLSLNFIRAVQEVSRRTRISFIFLVVE